PSSTAEEPDHRHRRLLRARRERPCCRRTAEQRNELAAFQMIELHSVPCQQARAGFQVIELARISQRVRRAFYNRPAIRRCLLNVRFTQKRTSAPHPGMSKPKAAVERAQSLAGSYRETYDCAGTKPGGVLHVWRGDIHGPAQDD